MKAPALTQVFGRNALERAITDALVTAGIEFEYEGGWLKYELPRRPAKYLPDIRVGNIILEGKGWFGRNGAKERQKFILVKEQHPDLDIRFIFSNANKPIYKGSPTTYGKWADDHGFKWSTKGMVPLSWLSELKRESKRVNRS